jgi:tetratricopeptide (TPR) repeat protein
LTFYRKSEKKPPKALPLWAQLVSGHESVTAIAFSVGNYPQLMRNFQEILAHPNLAEMRPSAGRPTLAGELAPWVQQVEEKQQFPQMLLALGALRLAKNFDAAEKLIQAHDANVPAEWRSAWENEKASLAWHSGRHDEARKAWDALEPIVPILFNRGMAALFAGDVVAAKQHLSAAVTQLPPTSAWHHLGRLYLTLADLRRP